MRVHFTMRNHVLPRIAGSSMGVVFVFSSNPETLLVSCLSWPRKPTLFRTIPSSVQRGTNTSRGLLMILKFTVGTAARSTSFMNAWGQGIPNLQSRRMCLKRASVCQLARMFLYCLLRTHVGCYLLMENYLVGWAAPTDLLVGNAHPTSDCRLGLE